MPTETDKDNKIQQAHEAGHGAFGSHDEVARQLKGIEDATAKAEAERAAGTQKLEDYANDSANATRQAEENAGWKTNVTPGTKSTPTKTNFTGKVKGFLGKKKNAGALAGIIGGTGIIGMLFSLFGPLSMVIGFTQNMLDTNDGAESAFQSRILHVLGLKMSDEDGLCDTKKVKCKMGRMSTKSLQNLAKREVVAFDADGNDLSKSKGKYPGSKIAYYEVGGIEDPIPAGQMKQHLANNATVASKVLGRYGAFNVRFHVWSSKYLKAAFNKIGFDWKKDGGIADGENDADTKPKDLLGKIKEKIPGIEGLSEGAQTKIRAHTEKLVDRGKKGGTAYLAAVGGCIGIKLPGLISNSVAAIQLVRMMNLITDTQLEAGSENQAAALSNISSYDVAAVGNLLTAKDTNNKSAIDSKYFLAAIGVNKAKTGLSKKFTPGYSLLTNPAIQATKKGAEKSEATCNVVLSPQAMYTAAAVNAAATVAASATIVGGVIKVAAEWAIGEIVGKVVEQFTDEAVAFALNEAASNDALDKALGGEPGEELGDALGIAAMGFFSAGAASRHVPVLKQAQLAAYNDQQVEQDNFQRNLDLATLSPFDTSSKYTFLGSIVNNVNTTLLANGGYGYSSGSLFSFLSAPFSMLSSTASASTTSDSVDYCGYAEEFGMDAGELTPAVNASGLPCYGYTGNIETERALNIASGDNTDKEKWIKDEAAEEANITDITEDDSRLDEYLTGCGADSIANGEWQDTAAGCTVDTAPTQAQTIQREGGDLPVCTGGESDEQAQGCYNPDTDSINTSATTKSSTAEEAEAVAAFAMDYQISQSVDGFDDEEDGSKTGTNAGTDFYISSYNITTKGSGNAGRQQAVNQIKSHGREGFDVVGTQELEQPAEYNFVYNAMKDKYDAYPEPGGSVYRNSAYARTIFWKRDKFELVKTDEVTFKRMEAVTDGGRGGDPQPAHAPIVWLRDKQTGQEIIVMNTHNPAFGAYAQERYNAAKAYMAKLTELKKEGKPMFFTGDFNEGTGLRQGNNATYQQNIENLFYCMASSTNTLYSAQDTANGKKSSCPAGNQGPIDFIYHSPEVDVESFNRINDSGSDHAAIYAHIIVPSADAEGEVIAGPSKDGWVWPVPGVKTMGILGYGESGSKGVHKGIDIGISGGAALGRTVVAAHAGTVARVWGQGDACGAYISIKADGTNYYAAYQHIDGASISVRQGQTVTAGQAIAKIGRQGGSTCGSSGFYHLHFSIENKASVSAYADPFPNGTVDPLKVLPR